MLHHWKVSAGSPGFAGVGLKYFKSASEDRRVSICDHWMLHYINKKAADGETRPTIAPKPHHLTTRK